MGNFFYYTKPKQLKRYNTYRQPNNPKILTPSIKPKLNQPSTIDSKIKQFNKMDSMALKSFQMVFCDAPLAIYRTEKKKCNSILAKIPKENIIKCFTTATDPSNNSTNFDLGQCIEKITNKNPFAGLKKSDNYPPTLKMKQKYYCNLPGGPYKSNVAKCNSALAAISKKNMMKCASNGGYIQFGKCVEKITNKNPFSGLKDESFKIKPKNKKITTNTENYIGNIYPYIYNKNKFYSNVFRF